MTGKKAAAKKASAKKAKKTGGKAGGKKAKKATEKAGVNKKAGAKKAGAKKAGGKKAGGKKAGGKKAGGKKAAETGPSFDWITLLEIPNSEQPVFVQDGAHRRPVSETTHALLADRADSISNEAALALAERLSPDEVSRLYRAVERRT